MLPPAPVSRLHTAARTCLSFAYCRLIPQLDRILLSAPVSRSNTAARTSRSPAYCRWIRSLARILPPPPVAAAATGLSPEDCTVETMGLNTVLRMRVHDDGPTRPQPRSHGRAHHHSNFIPPFPAPPPLLSPTNPTSPGALQVPYPLHSPIHPPPAPTHPSHNRHVYTRYLPLREARLSPVPHSTPTTVDQDPS